MSKKAYIALGSNIGNASENIDSAVRALDSVPMVSVEKVSSFFRTKPWGYDNQPDFINACVRISTDLSPEALVGVCLGIEAGMGRIREIKNGPRIIDLDVIIYEGEERSTEELILPHPRYKERDFVLVPLSEVAEADIKDEIRLAAEKLDSTYIYK